MKTLVAIGLAAVALLPARFASAYDTGRRVCPGDWPTGEIEPRVVDGTVEAAFSWLHATDRVTDSGYGLLGGGLTARLGLYAGKFFVRLSASGLIGSRTRERPPDATDLEKVELAVPADIHFGIAWQNVVETGLRRIIRSETWVGVGTYEEWCAESQATRKIHGLGVGAKSLFVASRLPSLEAAFALGPQIGWFFEQTGARTGRTLGFALFLNYAVYPVPDPDRFLRGLGGEARFWSGFGPFHVGMDAWLFGRALYLGASLGWHAAAL